MQFLQQLDGYKTYIAIALGAVVVLANAFLGVSIPGVTLDKSNWLQDLWALVLLATGRSAIAKVR
jgi:hypothetical protein